MSFVLKFFLFKSEIWLWISWRNLIESADSNLKSMDADFEIHGFPNKSVNFINQKYIKYGWNVGVLLRILRPLVHTKSHSSTIVKSQSDWMWAKRAMKQRGESGPPENPRKVFSLWCSKMKFRNYSPTILTCLCGRVVSKTHSDFNMFVDEWTSVNVFTVLTNWTWDVY